MQESLEMQVQFLGLKDHGSCLENSTDRGALWATVHGITKNRTQLSMQAGKVLKNQKAIVFSAL